MNRPALAAAVGNRDPVARELLAGCVRHGPGSESVERRLRDLAANAPNPGVRLEATAALRQIAGAAPPETQPATKPGSFDKIRA